MNKNYRSLWNESLGAWVATSEVSHARGKRGGSRVALAAAAGGVLASFPSGRLRAGVMTALVAMGGIGCSSLAQAQTGNCNAAPYNFYNGSVSCMGFLATATGPGATALGYNARADLDGGLAVGFGAHSAAQNAIALGSNAVATTQYSVAIGLNAAATGAGGAMALGQGTIASNVNAVALGVQATATSAGASALGTFANASGGTPQRSVSAPRPAGTLHSPEVGEPWLSGCAASPSDSRQMRPPWMLLRKVTVLSRVTRMPLLSASSPSQAS